VSPAIPFARRAATLTLALESFAIGDRRRNVKRVWCHQQRCRDGWFSG
jgi:hypothetical protein